MGTVELSKIVTARKPYECAMCERPILPRTRYFSYHLGQRHRETWCLDCAAGDGGACDCIEAHDQSHELPETPQ